MVLKVLEVTQSEPTNIFSESHYTTQACRILSFAKSMFQKDSISKIMQTIEAYCSPEDILGTYPISDLI